MLVRNDHQVCPSLMGPRASLPLTTDAFVTSLRLRVPHPGRVGTRVAASSFGVCLPQIGEKHPPSFPDLGVAMDTHNEVGRGLLPIQWGVICISVGFLLVGILGFVPGVTSNAEDLEWVGHDGNVLLLAVFEVSIFHNLVHVTFGIIGLLASRWARASQTYLVGGGLIYLVLWVYGLVIDQSSDANFIPLNDADNWLHLGLGAAMVLLGILLGPRSRSSGSFTNVDYRS